MAKWEYEVQEVNITENGRQIYATGLSKYSEMYIITNLEQKGKTSNASLKGGTNGTGSNDIHVYVKKEGGTDIGGMTHIINLHDFGAYICDLKPAENSTCAASRIYETSGIAESLNFHWLENMSEDAAITGTVEIYGKVE